MTSAPHPTHCWEGSWQTSGWTPGSARVSLLHREAKLARLGAGMESLGTDTSLGATLVLKHGEGQAWPPLPHWQLLGAAPGVLPLISGKKSSPKRKKGAESDISNLASKLALRTSLLQGVGPMLGGISVPVALEWLFLTQPGAPQAQEAPRAGHSTWDRVVCWLVGTAGL